MNIRLKLSLMVAALALSSTLAVLADGPVRKDGILDGWFGDVNGNALKDPKDLVFDKDGCDPGHPDVLTPVWAPDGHQLTWAEYNQARGRASVKCSNKGTHVVMKAAGLVPNGVYTVWLLTFDRDGNHIGEGSLGAPDGSQNSFTASAKGEADLSVFQLAEDLSEFGAVKSCLFDEAAFLLAVVYHPDGQTYGATPGPGSPNEAGFWCAFVEHLLFFYP